MSEVDALAGQLVGLFQPTITSLQTHLSEVTANQQALLETIKQEEEQFIDTEKLKEIEQMFAQIPAYNQKLHNIRAIMTDLQKRCANIHRITSGLDGEVRAKEMKVASSHAKKVLTGGQVTVTPQGEQTYIVAPATAPNNTSQSSNDQSNPSPSPSPSSAPSSSPASPPAISPTQTSVDDEVIPKKVKPVKKKKDAAV
eukprot:c469_g1_i1.p1 GENE.c469_g1_i1~~c469_g1_i1.p1  ORF type:complete len:198 (-),score=62.86 c469_g1_i1:165-758(-)